MFGDTLTVRIKRDTLEVGGSQCPQDSSNTSTDAFIEFLTTHRDDRLKSMSPEECVKEFRSYQAEFRQFVEASKDSVDEARCGDSA